MIDQRFLLWPVLLIALLFAVSWTFNHISAWAGVFLAIAAVFAINQYFKPKNRE